MSNHHTTLTYIPAETTSSQISHFRKPLPKFSTPAVTRITSCSPSWQKPLVPRGRFPHLKIKGCENRKKATLYGIKSIPNRTAPGGDINKPVEAANRAAEKHGLQDKVYFGILGHGVGTDLHIAPTLGDSSLKSAVKREIETLSENMVISLEPGIFYHGVGGGALENMILITEHGPRSGAVECQDTVRSQPGESQPRLHSRQGHPALHMPQSK